MNVNWCTDARTRDIFDNPELNTQLCQHKVRPYSEPNCQGFTGVSSEIFECSPQVNGV